MWGWGYQDGRPDQSVNKGYKLYSGARYVANWAPSFFIYLLLVNAFIGKRNREFNPRLGIVIQAYIYVRITGVCTCCNIPHTVHFIRRLCRRVCTCFKT